MQDKSFAQIFDRFHWLLLVVAVAGTVTIAYSNSFQVSFLFDDVHNIINNPNLKLSSISVSALHKAATESPSAWRYLSNISFALNYYYGGQNVFGFHLVNVLFHMATAFVFYFLALNTMRLPVLSEYHRNAREIALFAALLWVLHPVQSNAVTYIVQRMTSMAAFFSVSGLLFYVQGRLCHDSSVRRYLLYGGGIVCFALAVFSKENSAILPVLVLAYEFFFFRDIDLAAEWKRLLVLALAATGSVWAMGMLFVGRMDIFNVLSAGFAGRGFTLAERLLTESRVLFYYLGLLALPLPSRLRLDYDFLISKSIVSPPQTLLAVCGLVALVALMVILYRKGHRLAGFAVFWYLAALAIESSIVPLELVYEHRLYLPSMFPILALVCLAFRFGCKRIVVTRWLLVTVVTLCMLMTWQRNATWASPYDFWMDAVAKSPGRARVHINLSNELKKKGDYSAAMQHLQKAIELEPDYGMAYLNLGLLYKDIRLLEPAIATLKIALTKKRVAHAKIYYSLGLVYGQLGNYREAIKQAELALHVDSKMLAALVVMGVAYDEMGDLDTAYRKFAEARRRGHDSNILFYNWALTCNKMGRREEALAKVAEGLRMYPGNPTLLAVRRRIVGGR